MAMSHYGSFAGGFINAYLQARKLRMQQAYYEALIDRMKRQDQGSTQDREDFTRGAGKAQGLGGGSTKDWSKTATMAEGTNKEVYDYITQKATALGIDPKVALSVANSEGLKGFDPKNPDKGGDGGSSFGPFQLHYGGVNKDMPNAGLGDEFTKATGKDARDPSTWKEQIDFALDHASKNGWGSWNGAKAIGVAEREGLGGGDQDGGNRPALVDASDKIHATGNADATQLHPAFANRAAQLADEAYKATGERLSFNELHRTTEYQAKIRAEHEAMPGGVAAHPAAKPGTSYHEFGAAGDMNDNAAARWARTPGPDGRTPIERVGLERLGGQTGANDPNHIQLPKSDWGMTAQADTGQGYQVAGDNNIALSPEAAARSRAILARHRATPETTQQGPLTREQMDQQDQRRRDIGNTQLAPPGPDQGKGQSSVNVLSGFAGIPPYPAPPPRSTADAITPQDTSRQSDPRAVPQDDSSSFGPPLTTRQAPYNPDMRSIESQPTFPPVQGRELGPENVGRTTGRDWSQADQPAFPPVQPRELGPENVGRTTPRPWTEADQPAFPPVQGREVGPENAGSQTMTGRRPEMLTPLGGGWKDPRIQPPDTNPATRNMPYPGQRDPRGVYAPRPVVRTPASNVPARNAQPAIALRPAPRQAIPAPTDNGRFVTIDRPNADVVGRDRGAMQGTALNLSGLFGGRQAPPQPAPRPQFVPPPAPRPTGGAPTAANPNNPYWGPNTAGRADYGGPLMPQDITNYPVAGVNRPMPTPTVFHQPSIREVPTPTVAPDVAPNTGAPSTGNTGTQYAMNTPSQGGGIPPGPGMGNDDAMYQQVARNMMRDDSDSDAMPMAARRGGVVSRVPTARRI